MDVNYSTQIEVDALSVGGTDIPAISPGFLAITQNNDGEITIIGTDSSGNDTTTGVINNGGTAPLVHSDFDLTTQPELVNGSERSGLRAIKSVEVEIGGQCIDKHYGDWMDIWVGLSGNQQQWENIKDL